MLRARFHRPVLRLTGIRGSVTRRTTESRAVGGHQWGRTRRVVHRASTRLVCTRDQDVSGECRSGSSAAAAAPRYAECSPWARTDLERKTRRCLGLAQTDPFADLPQQQRGYPAAYWRAKAWLLATLLHKSRQLPTQLRKFLQHRACPMPRKRGSCRR